MPGHMKKSHEMQYSSQLEPLIMWEYGRNVQLLVEHAQTIEDPQLQYAFIEEIVNLILRLNPQSKNIEDYKDKLWKHIFHIAGYDLNILPPNGVKPLPPDPKKRPDRIPYPKGQTKYRHYGTNIQALIKKALLMEPGPVLDGFVQVIGSYMKLAYRNWNKEHFVGDDVIKDDLAKLSDGKLILAETASVDHLVESVKNNRKSAGNNVLSANYNTFGRDVSNTNRRTNNNNRSGGSGGGVNNRRPRKKK
jgi:hypothetical protein